MIRRSYLPGGSGLTEAAPPRPLDIRRAKWAIVLTTLFLATRALNVWFWRIPSVDFVQNDVSYYGYWLWCLLGDGAGDANCQAALANGGVMAEYPLPAVWFLQFVYTLGAPVPGWLPWFLLLAAIATLSAYVTLLTRGRRRAARFSAAGGALATIIVWFLVALPGRSQAFVTWTPLFACTMLALDAVVAILLFRHGSVRACLFWVLYIGACGPIVWFRFDILTAAAVALACLWVVRHPRVSGALVGLGAGIKLWPALLILPMSTPSPLRPGPSRSRLLGFVVMGAVLGGLSLLVGGWARSVSPLSWQSARGLQMESVPATPIHVLRTWTSDPSWTIALSEYNAIELFGPATGHLLRVSTLLTVGSILLTLALTWRLARNVDGGSRHQPQAVILCVLAVVLATIVANKTLSTQYVQWLAGPLAACLALPGERWLRRPLVVVASLLLAVAVLTQYTYPWGTLGIMALPNGEGIETAALVGRNLLLVLLAGLVAGLAWRATRSSGPGTAPELSTRGAASSDDTHSENL
ncbi:glycosyltransferase 87 family protein [Arachnia propionica]|uniref:DUF2029 domain-containing protein n=1 Tax=Arachnia propionica TaxID=1750 RepID=A0A3P1WYR3_9ACTN|nr:glycosyltransferase 87 family protein [Arachnia propionica]RRD50550.1 DUF2029 domain-containing protein [Arachnia propionica]